VNRNSVNPHKYSPLASVIVVTWNARRYVDECLRSLATATARLPIEIIVVDNASSDGTPDLIEEVLPQATFIRNRENLGFARGNNLGIARSRGRYLFLVNSDVTLAPGCVEKLIAVMEADPRIGLLGPQMLAPHSIDEHSIGPHLIDPHSIDPRSGEAAVAPARRSTMRFPTLWNQLCRALGIDSIFKSRWAGGFLVPGFAHDRTREVEVLNGWFWVARREAVEQVGPLDEQFFMYGEDIDWCYRFQQSGWKRVFYAGVSAVHYGGASSAAAPARFYVEMQRANVQYWKKHHGRLARTLYQGIAALHQALRCAGYGLLFLARPGSPSQASHKVRRSWAALRWLFHRNPGAPPTPSCSENRRIVSGTANASTRG